MEGFPLWHAFAFLVSSLAAAVSFGVILRYQCLLSTRGLKKIFYGVGSLSFLLFLSSVSSGLFMMYPRDSVLYRIFMQIYHVIVLMMAAVIGYTAYRIKEFAEEYSFSC